MARARRLATDRLAIWEVAGDVCDTAELVVSELFTNAVVHTASGRVVCELRDRGARTDRRPRRGLPGDRTAVAVGRTRGVRAGLLLVDAMCSAWGTHDARHGAGRVVWADLAHDTAAPC